MRRFLDTEAGSGAVLLLATLAALGWANLPGDSYEDFWSTAAALQVGDWRLEEDLRHWVNDALMALFFLVIGLEIRRELDLGELRERRRIALPVLAAIGGMTMPVLLYLSIVGGSAWGVVLASDTAFVLALLALAGSRTPVRLRVFMLSVMIVDDVAALLVIAAVYTDDPSVLWLAVAAGAFGLVLALRWVGVRRGPVYLLAGIGLWLAVREAGLHPTLAGVALGLVVSAYPPSRRDLERAGALWRRFREQPTPALARTLRTGVSQTLSPNERLQAALHPWTSFVVVPIFALANAGVALGGGTLERAAGSTLTLGIVVALVGGKLLGLSGASWLANRVGRLPLPVGFPTVVAAAGVAGIGFTISLFVADLAFTGERLEEAKAGILAASVVAALLGWTLFRAMGRLPAGVLERSDAGTSATIEDLSKAVDPDVDHVRGPQEAPVTLLEYGDFECPYCGRAEPVIRELLESFGSELRYVFRHLPLPDVHPHAEMAAQAAEAAGAQGRFWEMHDLLLARQADLEPPALLQEAEELGLDVDRFWEDVRTGAFARRVARDVRSADESGVAGTPTFFINGRRHHGAYDLDSLTRAVHTARTVPAGRDR
ncbi:MAG TPA: Na+/H+ antiporter NhaA [Solirubrobacteraceae bacterium]|nr:Na+/H+ antiporter NhaA [Solirubrobacteraceae bacterium]